MISADSATLRHEKQYVSTQRRAYGEDATHSTEVMGLVPPSLVRNAC